MIEEYRGRSRRGGGPAAGHCLRPKGPSTRTRWWRCRTPKRLKRGGGNEYTEVLRLLPRQPGRRDWSDRISPTSTGSTGGSIKNVYATIKNGVPAKGMISWQLVFTPKQIQEIASYVLSLQGTNPPNAKKPEGNAVCGGRFTARTSMSEHDPSAIQRARTAKNRSAIRSASSARKGNGGGSIPKHRRAGSTAPVSP